MTTKELVYKELSKVLNNRILRAIGINGKREKSDLQTLIKLKKIITKENASMIAFVVGPAACIERSSANRCFFQALLHIPSKEKSREFMRATIIELANYMNMPPHIRKLLKGAVSGHYHPSKQYEDMFYLLTVRAYRDKSLSNNNRIDFDGIIAVLKNSKSEHKNVFKELREHTYKNSEETFAYIEELISFAKHTSRAVHNVSAYMVNRKIKRTMHPLSKNGLLSKYGSSNPENDKYDINMEEALAYAIVDIAKEIGADLELMAMYSQEQK